ncbi:MAG: hypothetical protein EBZ05_06225 [Verrucomicrobia bacterium]|nr:hypothetical protein [Verrucomicrobiota bacterium]
MSDAELRKQSRYTWKLIAFTATAIFFMAQQSRAGGDLQVDRVARPSPIGMSIERGSDLR